MAHGHADYGISGARKTVHPITDLGELAVRLGSFDTFDRRGNIVWMDDFESPTKKWKDDIIGSGSVVRSKVTARNGDFSMKLTTQATAEKYTGIFCFISSLVTGAVGAEISFTHGTAVNYVMLNINQYDGTNVLQGGLRYDASNKRLERLVSGATYATVATGISLIQDSTLFYPMKLVVSTATDKYVRAIFLNKEYDLSAHSLMKATNPLSPVIGSYFYIITGSDVAGVSYVDDFILTQNEP